MEPLENDINKISDGVVIYLTIYRVVRVLHILGTDELPGDGLLHRHRGHLRGSEDRTQQGQEQHGHSLELQTNHRRSFYNHRENPY